MGDFPQFEGCWGVYPHTAGSGYVYASNLDGRLYIFHTDIVTSDFQGSPRVGTAPLTVNFTDASPQSQSWRWYFGDGDTTVLENPSHVYSAGLYDVELRITSPQGTGTEFKPNYVTALAETLKVADTALGQSATAYWEIRAKNNVPIAEIKLPVRLGNVPALATFDSISTVGCRTNYFELQQIVYDNRPAGQEAIRLKADNGGGSPPLPPGDGPIARVYLTIQPNAAPNGQIALSLPPMGSHTLLATTLTTTYVPALTSGTITILSSTCLCDCHADPICDGQSDILDVSKTIDVAFRGVNPTIDINCPHAGRTDVNCSGATDIIDVINIISVAFRGADPATSFCDPCAL
ncbi:MAG: PKD domain-containing protein [candidate division Zixibacteria bacterium]|nr:PKD domain-containing protein [candidate division Zixibacteria bacterium]